MSSFDTYGPEYLLFTVLESIQKANDTLKALNSYIIDKSRKRDILYVQIWEKKELSHGLRPSYFLVFHIPVSAGHKTSE